MQTLDYAIFLFYILLALGIGARFARRQHRGGDFFLAGRSMHWFPIGLSILVTSFSAINYTAFSGEILTNGLYVILSLPIFVLVALPITRLFMPFFHRMGLTSAYEYLERRFDVRVRSLASGLFILWRLLWMAVLIYVPCKVLALATGIDLLHLILLAGLVATAYTLIGGMQAVMWTDVLQFFVLIGGLLLGVTIAALQTPDGLIGMLRLGVDAGLARPFYPFDPQVLSFDPHVRISLWSCWLGTFVAFLARYGADQVVLQRYFTARSLQQAQKGFRLNYLSAIFALLALALLGFALHAHALRANLPARGTMPPVFFFADFVRSLPAGVTGLIVAGLFAATMSSLDSGVNSCSAALITDFYQRFTPSSTADRELRWSRLATLVFGIIATLAATQVGRLGSIFTIANRFINGLGSPLLAIFLLGMFSRRANARGVLIGGLLGAVASAWISFAVRDLALHYYAAVNLAVAICLCYLFSLVENRFASPPKPDQLAWTWSARRSSEETSGK
ncbi:MAG: sodium/solute symporter [Gemmatimonadetes bacterium]|jgi:SSS family transporter|nr:sodium/solute symporter [Gemmatimonadota bacterium]